jgi:SAM-dependent methyltransferase
MNGSILSVTDEQWAHAQRDELKYWSEQGPDGDDWNAWWQEQFEDYYFVSTRAPRSMLEVGCGPFAGNTVRIITHRPAITNFIALNDPLMREYLDQEKGVSRIDAIFNSQPLEEMLFRGGYSGDPLTFDLIICVNVLDHVRDVEACFKNMYRHLAKHGMLIIGQDLTSEFDMANCKEMREDTMHPIKISLEAIAPFIFPHYNTEFLKILPRDKGRNPKAHYATLCWAGRKK